MQRTYRAHRRAGDGHASPRSSARPMRSPPRTSSQACQCGHQLPARVSAPARNSSGVACAPSFVRNDAFGLPGGLISDWTWPLIGSARSRRAAESGAGQIAALPGRDVVGAAGDHVGVAGDVLQRQRWPPIVGPRSAASRRSRSAAASRNAARPEGAWCRVPVENVERRRRLAHQVVVDPVVPDQVVGPEPGEDSPGPCPRARPCRARASGRAPASRSWRRGPSSCRCAPGTSSSATSSVSEPARVTPWARQSAARRAAVMPPEQAPSTLTSGAPVIVAAPRRGAVERRDVGLERPVALLGPVGLRQLTTKTWMPCAPGPRRWLRPGARSQM